MMSWSPCSEFDVMGDVGEDFVEVLDGGGEFRKFGRAVGASKEERAGIAEDAVHVADEFVGRADLGRGAEVSELGRGVAKGFLGAVGEGGEKVFEKGSFFVHGALDLFVNESSCRRGLRVGEPGLWLWRSAF